MSDHGRNGGVVSQRDGVLAIVKIPVPSSAHGRAKANDGYKSSSHCSRISSPKHEPALSVLPLVCSIFERREHRPTESPLPQAPQLNLISPLGNGRDVYGNYLSSPPKDSSASSTGTECPPKSPNPKSRIRETLGDFHVVRPSPTLTLNNSTLGAHKSLGTKSAVKLRGGSGIPQPTVHTDRFKEDGNQMPPSTSSLYTSASVSYMKGRQSPSPSPKSSSQDSNDLYQGQSSSFQVPTGRGMRPLTNVVTSYGRTYMPRRDGPRPPSTVATQAQPNIRNMLQGPVYGSNPDDGKTVEQLIDEALDDQVHNWAGQLDPSTWSTPSKPYCVLGPPRMNDYDNESILTSAPMDDQFTGLEGLHDSGPYTKLKQQQQVKHIRAMRERNRIREEERRQARLTRHPWTQDYEVGSTVVPSDSISQVGYLNYSRGQRTRASYDQGPLPADIYPRPLVPPSGSMPVISSCTQDAVAQESAFTTRRLVSKVSRFLLSAPSDPDLKTYSNRFPPRDSADAKTNIFRQNMYATNRKDPKYNLHPTMAAAATTATPPPHPRIQSRPSPPPTTIIPPTPKSSTSTKSLIKFPSFPFPFLRRATTTVSKPLSPKIDKSTISCPLPYMNPNTVPTTTTTTPTVIAPARYEPSVAESDLTMWPEEDSARNVVVARARGVLRGGRGSGSGSGSATGSTTTVSAAAAAASSSDSPSSQIPTRHKKGQAASKRKTGTRRKWHDVGLGLDLAGGGMYGMGGLGAAG